MYQNIFEITEDGCGVHTFELTMPSITRSEFEQISKKAVRKFYSKDGKNICIHPGIRGIRIYLNHTDLNFYNIKIIVAPRQVIDENAKAFSIFRSSDDFDTVRVSVDYAIEHYLGEGYTADDFSLSRVDLCVNIMLSEIFSAKRYVKLIRRSMIYNDRAEIITFPEDVPNAAVKNAHSFRINTGFTTFTAYDKYFQLNDIGESYETVSPALLRLELAINRDMIREIKNTLSKDFGNIKMVGYMAYTSRKWFEEYIKNHFLAGDYYYLSNMRTAIEKSKIRPKIKSRMLEYLEMQWGKRSFTTAKNEILELLGSDYKLKKMLKAFESLDVYPISLSYRDKHGEKAVPGLYKIFGL